MDLEPCRAIDVEALTAFLSEVDLTLSGLDASSVRLWIERDESGAIVGSTGYEISSDGRHALIRSVAVSPSRRSSGRGSALAGFALERAADEGVTRAWLFSRRSGPFWQSLGFESADRDELAAALADTHQVRMFQQTGQLGREVAWSRSIAGDFGEGAFRLASLARREGCLVLNERAGARRTRVWRWGQKAGCSSASGVKRTVAPGGGLGKSI